MTKTPDAGRPVAPHTLRVPPQPTTFVGRTQELAEIGNALRDPSCRLLTLVGPGGMGKTRLAIEVSTQIAEHFTHGVYFVPLQSVQSTDVLVSAIADTLDVSLAGQVDPLVQLCNYVRDKNVLLVLDNFEQLLPASGANVLVQILRAAPEVHLLVTTREVLNVQEEWLYGVHGLALPDTDGPDDPVASDAVQLFVERARRVRRDFSPTNERDNVLAICRLVEGMPLALELAASWVKNMRCTEIVAEIQDNLEFLATNLRNVPDRHRSMRAVFAQSWEFLTSEERDVFERLSVFRGGFTREAAERVADATLPVLSTLVDKSLLRWESAGRYQMHELLRQWGEERLARSANTFDRTRDLHAAYYTAFLGDRFDDLTGEGQQTALAEIAAELDNVRTAWQWAIRRGRVTDLDYAAMGLHTFYQYRGRFREGVEAFADAIDAVEAVPSSSERDAALAMLLTCAGWFEMRFGRVREATRMQKRALSLYDAHDLLPPPGQGTDPLTALSLLAATAGEYEQAMAYGTQAWNRAMEHADTKNMAFARHGLASAALAQGDYETALQYAREALALAKSSGNRWFTAYVYDQLGQISQALGDVVAAGDYYRVSYSIKEELDDPEGMALALSHLGEIALARDEYRAARDLYRQSVALYETLGDRGGLVRTLQGLGIASAHLEDAATARRQFGRALRVARDTQTVPLILSLLLAVGTFLLDHGAPQRGLTTLVTVEAHPAGDKTTRERARHLLASHAADDSSTGDESVPLELDALITLLLAELSSSISAAEHTQVIDHPDISSEDQPLIEPLSERELEVLALIAAGLKNREIAADLTIALSTVKTHINNIYGKLGVSNRVQAVARARDLDLLA